VGRKRTYAVLMGTCLGLFLLAGLVVRHYSTGWAIGLCAVAAVIPPVAAFLANRS
jgi:hypothetical protein